MSKRLTLFIALLFLAASLYAQKASIKGVVCEKESSEKLYKATVQLFKSDSTFLRGTVTDEQGVFEFKATDKGKYLVKVSSVGFKDAWLPVTVSQGKTVKLGTIALNTDAVMLKEAVVTANLPKVVMKEDTFVYNAGAYRVPEGSTLEALVESLPGAKIDDSGNITINGKSVSKIKIDGRDFSDSQLAMKNIPTDIVDKVKAYDEKSDLAKLTGIDDGNEKTVLDFGVKPKMRGGYLLNADVGAGTHDRYAARVFGMKMLGTMRYNFIGNINNNNGQGFGRGRGGWGGGSGQRIAKNSGLNINYESRDKSLRIDGGVNWRHNNADNWSRSSMENFVNKTGAFSNNVNQNYSRSNSWNAQMNLQWRVDSLTHISFRPNVQYSTSDSRGFGTSASYRDNPYNYADDPLSDKGMTAIESLDSVIVNAQRNKSIGHSVNKSASGSFNLFRRLSRTGRNVSLNLDFNIGDNMSRNLSTSHVHLYQMRDRTGNDSTYQTNRYTTGPSNSLSYSVGFTYSEPLWKQVFLQLNYRFNYSYNKSDPSTYDFPDLGEDVFVDVLNRYGDWGRYFGYLPNDLETYLDQSLSRYSERKNYNQNIDVQLRVVREKYDGNIGISIRPQHARYVQDYLGINVDTTRNVTNISPTLDFRYKFNKQTNLRVNYRGSSSQPGIQDLLDITDDTDPLNIRKGNPGLKPSFTTDLNTEFRTYLPRHQTNISTNLHYASTRNSISRMVTYNELTGGSVSQPENINGNWNANFGLNLTTAFDTTGVFGGSYNSNISYSNRVGYVNLTRQTSSEKNTVKSLTLNQGLSFWYRNSWFEATVSGSFNYEHTRNELIPTSNMNVWDFNYGLNLQATTPWGMSLSTNLRQSSRRGYADKEANTDELIWNAQVSQRFLHNRALTVMLQFYDILGQRSNFSHSIDATRRLDSWNNSINSYAMLHVQYRLNLFGGRGGGRRSDHRPDGPRQGGEPGRGGFGPPPGGFPGGPPGR